MSVTQVRSLRKPFVEEDMPAAIRPGQENSMAGFVEQIEKITGRKPKAWWGEYTIGGWRGTNGRKNI